MFFRGCDFLETNCDEMVANVVKSHFTRFDFQKISRSQIFSARSAVFVFGWDFFCFVLLWLFSPLPCHSVLGSFKQTKSATVTGTVAVQPCVIFLSIFLCRSLQNNNVNFPISNFLNVFLFRILTLSRIFCLF